MPLFAVSPLVSRRNGRQRAQGAIASTSDQHAGTRPGGLVAGTRAGWNGRTPSPSSTRPPSDADGLDPIRRRDVQPSTVPLLLTNSTGFRTHVVALGRTGSGDVSGRPERTAAISGSSRLKPSWKSLWRASRRELERHTHRATERPLTGRTVRGHSGARRPQVTRPSPRSPPIGHGWGMGQGRMRHFPRTDASASTMLASSTNTTSEAKRQGLDPTSVRTRERAVRGRARHLRRKALSTQVATCVQAGRHSRRTRSPSTAPS